MKIKGKKFVYQVKKVRLPNGATTSLEMITHPGAALIVPFLSPDKVIFLRQYRAVLGQYLLELPAGTLDPAEAPLACARRELTEETGYRAGRITRLGQIYPVPGYSTETIHIYRAERLTPCHAEKDADEIITLKVLTRRQAQDGVARGRIRDAKTICALALCGWLGTDAG